MLSNDLRKTERFLKKAGETKDAMLKLANAWDGVPNENSEQLLSLVHTLKGNARSLNFTNISESLHDFEDAVRDLNDTSIEITRHQFQQRLARSTTLISDYQYLYSDKFANLRSGEKLDEKVELREFLTKELKPVLIQTSQDLGKQAPKVVVEGNTSIANQSLLDDIFDMFLPYHSKLSRPRHRKPGTKKNAR